MAKEPINRAGMYSRYLRDAKTSGVFFLVGSVLFVSWFLYSRRLLKNRSNFATFIKNFHLGIDL